MNQKIIFPDKFDAVILDILKKYGFLNTIKEYFEESMEGIAPATAIIVYMIKDLIDIEKTEEESISYLQENLKITKEVAKKIFKEVKEKVIAFVKIVDVKEEPDNYSQDEVEKKYAPIKKLKAPLTVSDAMTKKKESIKDFILPEIKPLSPEETDKKTKQAPNEQQPKKADFYREPIE